LILEKAHAPYVETVPLRTVAAFTALQLAAVGAIYGVTWAGVAGVLFPLPIVLLVPLRHLLLPKLFDPGALLELDRPQTEAAAGLPHAQAVAAAAEGTLRLRPPCSTGAFHCARSSQSPGLPTSV
jgi:hypothetical protein